MSRQLTNAEANHLIEIYKCFTDEVPVEFPLLGESKHFDLHADEEDEKFILTINRTPRYNSSKFGYQTRTGDNIILVRIDMSQSKRPMKDRLP